MPYTEEALDEMQYDPVRMKAYFWHLAMKAKQRAAKKETCIDPELEERFANTILENIDTLIESCLLER